MGYIVDCKHTSTIDNRKTTVKKYQLDAVVLILYQHEYIPTRQHVQIGND